MFPASAGTPRPSLVVVAEPEDVKVTSSTQGSQITLTTSAIVVVADTTSGLMVSAHSLANPTMVLSQNDISFTPTSNTSLYNISTRFTSSAGSSEKLYGGGQYFNGFNGFMDYNQATIEMIQFNTEAIVPFFVSTAGYGIYMDQYSHSWLNPPRPQDQVPLTNQSSTKFVGSYTVQEDGPVHVFYNLSRGYGGSQPLLLTVGDQVCSDFQSHNHPDSMSCRLTNLTKGQTYPITATLNAGTINVFIRPSGSGNVFASENEQSVNMFVVFPKANSPTMVDGLVAQYRTLTGAAPMFGLWAYGFWQCKEHYATRDQVLDAALGFRERKLPVDNIVQDW
jgi:alpha-D-xyloside xylohydrolase